MFCIWHALNGNNSSLYCCLSEPVKKCPYSEPQICFSIKAKRFYIQNSEQNSCSFEPLPKRTLTSRLT